MKYWQQEGLMKLNIQQQPIVIVHCSTKQEWLKRESGCYFSLRQGLVKIFCLQFAQKLIFHRFCKTKSHFVRCCGPVHV